MNKKSVKKSDISEILNNGKMVSGKFVNLYYKKGDNLKISFLITKKIKGVVKRNRLRRKLREGWRLNKKEQLRLHMCVMAKDVSDKATVCELVQDIEMIINQIKTASPLWITRT